MLVRGLLPLKVKHCFVKQDASIQGNSITGTQGYEDPIMGTVAGRPKASGYRVIVSCFAKNTFFVVPGGLRRGLKQFGKYPLKIRFVAENSCQRVRALLFEKSARAAISRKSS